MLGIAPLTGIPLPFVSYGGSNLVVQLASVGILLNIAANERAPDELRCLIAAGGTAGHVLPSLAVADALRERGVQVTFAGSPDRVEAQLVPEHGYEFDPFRVSGLPRRPSSRSCARCSLAARRRSRARGSCADGGRTSCSAAAASSPGPMVLAAWRRRIPAALTEADAHLGLANRLAAPFARRVFLAFPIDGPDGAEVPRHRPADAGRAPRRDAAEGRRRFGLPARRPGARVFGGSSPARAA